MYSLKKTFLSTTLFLLLFSFSLSAIQTIERPGTPVKISSGAIWQVKDVTTIENAITHHFSFATPCKSALKKEGECVLITAKTPSDFFMVVDVPGENCEKVTYKTFEISLKESLKEVGLVVKASKKMPSKDGVMHACEFTCENKLTVYAIFTKEGAIYSLWHVGTSNQNARIMFDEFKVL
jgi:hypothetical protein